MPEAVYGPGKTPEHCAAIVGELLGAGTGPVLVTRASEDQVKAVSAHTDALGYGLGDMTETGLLRTVSFRSAPPRLSCGGIRGESGATLAFRPGVRRSRTTVRRAGASTTLRAWMNLKRTSASH